VTIWTAVETATAIVGASIPVLRVFFKDTISSFHSHSGPTSRSNPSAKSGSVPLASLRRISASRISRHASGVINGDSVSEWSILREAEDDGVIVEEGNAKGQMHGGILQTSTITIMYEGESSDSAVDRREKGVGIAI
jgi:hypothetical protein